ncbi:MAG: hypothetical protein Q7T82_18465 [Armatimonadota bacterium]|nr:hypothetical protein [Armatimonadota bacterium]
MIQIILLVAGIFTAVRLPKLLRRASADYPGVDPDAFQRWHQADLKSAYAFLIATWGALAVQIVVLIAAGTATGVSQDLTFLYVGYAISFLVFLGPLIWAAILGSKAARLKKEAGITK